MKSTVKLLLDPRRQKIDNTFPICLKIIHKRTSTYITLDYSVLPEHWDAENFQILKSCKKYSNLSRINNSIIKKRIDADDVIEKLTASGELDNLSITELKNRILNQSTKITFRDFNNKIIKELKLSNKFGNASCYEQAQSFLDKYSNGKELSFEEINYSLIKKIESQFLSKGKKVKGIVKQNTLNSLSFYLRTIRAVYNRAIKEGIVKRDLYPFISYSIKETKTVKRAIRKTDIDKIRELKIDAWSQLWHARNYFMFSFYNIGMNFSDIAFLKKSNVINERIDYVRVKTGKKYSIKLNNPAKKIINLYKKMQAESEYVFPIIKREKLEEQIKDIQNERKTFNKYLKRIGAECGIELNLTSYVARHSWATIAKDLNIPVSVISEGLGHEDIKTTQIYLDSFDVDVIDKANQLISG